MENNTWEILSPEERKNYVQFHKNAYVDDVHHAEEVLFKHPRWSVISGYYAMHDATKLFLAQQFAVKISAPNIHNKAIEALGEKIQDTQIKEKLLNLLRDAKEVYFNIERLKEKVLPELLRQGKRERAKSQYYTEDYTSAKIITSQKASYFLDTFVKPYIKIMEDLLR